MDIPFQSRLEAYLALNSNQIRLFFFMLESGFNSSFVIVEEADSVDLPSALEVVLVVELFVSGLVEPVFGIADLSSFR